MDKEVRPNEKMSSMTDEHREICDWLKNVKFKRCIIGGVDEADVWKKIEQLNLLYEKLLIAQRAYQDEDHTSKDMGEGNE